MRKLIVEEWLSLDGYVSDKMGKLDFFAKYVRESYTTEQRMDLLNSIDTILFGRKTYVQFATLWPDRPIKDDVLAEKINMLPKIVFSGSLEEAPWGKWPEAIVAKGDPVEEIKRLKALTGKDMVLWGSINLAQEMITHHLVDEYHLHICPTLTGGGRKLFPDEMEPLSLSLLNSSQFANGVVLVKYGTPG